jgi:arylsulfatase A-like enzyme
MHHKSMMSSLAVASLAGAAIGSADWLLGERTTGTLSLVWTASICAIGSCGLYLAAIALARLSGRLTPAWIWCWAWLGLYTLMFVNVALLPRQSFLTLPSMALTASLCLAAGAVSWPLGALARRFAPLAHRPWVKAAGVATITVSLAIAVLVPLTLPRPDLSAHHSPRNPGELNAVVILIDTLRADHLSSYGYPRPTTPNIDALASRGVRFSNAWSTSSWTVPAVASLFSGLPLSSHRTGGVDTGFDVDETLAEAISGTGAVTAAFTANPLVSSLYGFERGFDTFVSCRDGLVNPIVDLAEGTTLGRLLLRRMDADRMVVQSARTWLRHHQRDRFLLYLHLFSPHRPYEPPEAQRTRFVNPSYDGIEYHGAAPGRSLSEPALRNTLERYDAEIAYADELVGEMVEHLARLGLARTTMVVVTSDHGEAFGEHGHWEHGQSVYTEEARIPLIIAHPLAGSGVVEEAVSLADVHPTVRSLFGAPAMHPTPALDLSGAILGASLGKPMALPQRPILTELLGEEGSTHPETMEAVALGGLRLVHNVTRGTRELFDIAHDPSELLPLADPGQAGLMQRHLVPEWWAPGTALAGRITLTDEDLQKLRSLGYVR